MDTHVAMDISLACIYHSKKKNKEWYLVKDKPMS
jgi:hypothetical protein